MSAEFWPRRLICSAEIRPGDYCSLENTPREAPWFYIVYAAVLLTGMAIALSGVNIVDLNIGIQAMNALLPPRHGDSAIPAPHLASCFYFAGQASVKGSFGSRVCGP